MLDRETHNFSLDFEGLVAAGPQAGPGGDNAGARAGAEPRPHEVISDAQILLIDPEPDPLNQAGIRLLRQQGCGVDSCHGVAELPERLDARGYDLVIMDAPALGAGAPALFELLAARGIPLIILSANAEPLDQVAALEFGADDYVSKAAHPLELLARVRAVIRRDRRSPEPRVVEAESWSFDRASRTLTSPDGKVHWLNDSSIAMLVVFTARPRETLSRATLSELMFGSVTDVETRSVDVRMARLRRLLSQGHGREMLRTVRGLGYVLDVSVTLKGALVLFSPTAGGVLLAPGSRSFR